MTQTNVRVQMQIRRDTAANWNSANPVLLIAEWGFETDSGKIKIGDGSTAWQQLDYAFVSTKGGNMTDHFTIHSQKELRLSDHVQGGAQEHHSSFKAGVQSADADYTLPTALPTSSGQVLSCTDAGVMSWASDSTTDSTKMPLAGGSFVGDVIFDNATNAGNDITWDMSDNALEFNDNVKAIFGTDSTGPMELFHHSSDWNIIRNKAAGGLFIESQEDQTGIEIYPDSWVKLRYAGGERLATTVSGISVTGTISAATSSATVGTLERSTTGNVALQFKNSTASMYCGLTTSATGFAIDDDNNLGSGPMLFVDRSSGNVGIGTDDPFNPTGYRTLELSGTTGGCLTFSDDEVQKWEVYGAASEFGIYDRANTRYNLKCYDTGDVEVVSGNLKLAATKGISFSNYGNEESPDNTATDVTSNTLSDYEEGAWSPSLASGNHSNATGLYTKVGRVVHVWMYVIMSTNSSSTAMIITGLPFTSLAVNANIGGSISLTNVGTACTIFANSDNDSLYIRDFGNTAISQGTFSGKFFYAEASYQVA